MSGFDNSVLFITKSSEGEQARFYYSSDLTEHFDLYNSDGSPEGSIAADKGSMCSDTTNGTLYIKTTDTVNTGWQILVSGSLTITGDSGGALSPTAGNWNIIGQDGITTQGTGSTLTITPRGVGTNNMFLGQSAGNLTLSGYSNVSFGAQTLTSLTNGYANVAVGHLALLPAASGLENTAIGTSSLRSLVSGSYNTAVGSASLFSNNGSYNTAIGRYALESTVSTDFNTSVGYISLRDVVGSVGQNTAVGAVCLSVLLTGGNNTAIGYSAGSAYTSSESNNILIKNSGVIGDGNTIRIGTQGSGAGQQDKAFIAGIVGVTVSGAQSVTIDSSGQLGVGAASFTGWVDVTDTSDALEVNTGYVANNAGLVTLTLPATASFGDVIKIAGFGGGGWTVAQNASQTIHFGNVDTTTGVGGSLSSTNRYDQIELLCTATNTDFVVRSSIGNITVV